MLKAFWQVRPDAKLAIGQVAPAGGKPRKDMTGVYSKLQAWRVFDEGPCRYDKVLLMDGSMCVASNVDEIFENEAPAAVVNSDADFTRKDLPSGEFHFRSKTSTWRTTEGETMKCGINGGLVLLEPSTKVFEDMIRELTVKKTPTDMGAYEFLSWYWGREPGKWHELPGKFNFRVHHLFSKLSARDSIGQWCASSFWWTVKCPEDVMIYHFATQQKPSKMLLRMPTEDVAWLQIDELITNFVNDMEASPTVQSRMGGENSTLKGARLQW